MVRRSGAAIGVAGLFSPLCDSIRDTALTFVDHFTLPVKTNGLARSYIFWRRMSRNLRRHRRGENHRFELLRLESEAIREMQRQTRNRLLRVASRDASEACKFVVGRLADAHVLERTLCMTLYL